MPKYVDYEMPAELVPQIVEMISVAREGGKLKKGVNETTKAIERKTALFVVLAQDVTPEEIVTHIPMICKEKGIPYGFVTTKKELGDAIGIKVGVSAVAVENAGAATEKLQDIIKKLPKPKEEKKK